MYSVLIDGQPAPIRHIWPDGNGGTILSQAVVTPWECDPCNPPNRRYNVPLLDGTAYYYPWYAIALYDDDDRAISCKRNYCAKVQAASDRLNELQREYNLLTR